MPGPGWPAAPGTPWTTLVDIAAAALVHDAALHEPVLCTHGELIGQVLERLVAEGVSVDSQLRWPKGSTWVLAIDRGSGSQARYLMPLQGQL